MQLKQKSTFHQRELVYGTRDCSHSMDYHAQGWIERSSGNTCPLHQECWFQCHPTGIACRAWICVNGMQSQLKAFGNTRYNHFRRQHRMHRHLRATACAGEKLLRALSTVAQCPVQSYAKSHKCDPISESNRPTILLHGTADKTHGRTLRCQQCGYICSSKAS